jgi:hypothetical protein
MQVFGLCAVCGFVGGGGAWSWPCSTAAASAVLSPLSTCARPVSAPCQSKVYITPKTPNKNQTQCPSDAHCTETRDSPRARVVHMHGRIGGRTAARSCALASSLLATVDSAAAVGARQPASDRWRVNPRLPGSGPLASFDEYEQLMVIPQRQPSVSGGTKFSMLINLRPSARVASAWLLPESTEPWGRSLYPLLCLCT